MANKTRTNILSQIYEYIPQANVTSHDTLIDNLCDLAVEEISMAHNFTYLRATSPATYDVVADEYKVAESDFSFTNFKEILFLQWIKSGTGENAPITFTPLQAFLNKYPYVEYSGNTDGKPKEYTRLGDEYIFNCQLDETVTMRAWYQQYHGAFADDNASHSFQPDMVGFQAIVATVLVELHESLPALQMSNKVMQVTQKKAYWINRLIEEDLANAAEEITFAPKHRKAAQGSVTDPYHWI